MTDKYLTHESMLEIAEQRERENREKENEEAKKPNEFGTSLNEWYNSNEYKQLQKDSEASVQRAVGKYHMLSEEDKHDMVQAICFIMCKAEKEGTSHRGLMNELGIYPSGFWISELIDVHNALYSEFRKRENDAELDREIKLLQDFKEILKNH